MERSRRVSTESGEDSEEGIRVGERNAVDHARRKRLVLTLRDITVGS